MGESGLFRLGMELTQVTSRDHYDRALWLQLRMLCVGFDSPLVSLP